MVIFYFLYSVIVTVLVMIYSLICVLLFWWFLFLPKYRKFRLFSYIVALPWIFFVMKLLLGTRFKVIGKDNIDLKRTTLYICNHQSWVDVPVLIKYTKAIGVSKKEVLVLPLVGILIYYAGTIMVDRVDRSSRIGIVKELITVFKKGISVTLFPEGTRSKDGRVLSPNNAVIKLCYKLKVPVVAASVEGTSNILPKDRFYLKIFQKVVLKFNEPVYPKDFKDEEEFAAFCWNQVTTTHKEITKEHFPEKYNKIYSDQN